MIPLTYHLFDVGWALSIFTKTAQLAKRVGYPRRIIAPRSVLRGRDVLRVEAFGRTLVPPRTREDVDHPRIGFVRIADRTADCAERDSRIYRWIAQDERPVVYVGFGSMPVRDFDGVVGDLSRELAGAGVRLIAVPGWSARTDDAPVDTDDLLVVQDIDHAAVLPRCAVVVQASLSLGAAARAELASSVIGGVRVITGAPPELQPVLQQGFVTAMHAANGAAVGAALFACVVVLMRMRTPYTGRHRQPSA
ncbi:glycosyltransferase [Tsukamurella pseudospumae]|uniref:Uncharacterized protein n=1 Tax=Tsukamurella pseudospumae TaxID=239498 RepID=A0A137YTB6_9ACTN|nr:hypothetical protein [Tsukamurella pseudospumae]KXO89117.1 hypothetical protein AXK61_10910 [Tsukamurella pseudospumae]